MVHSMFDSFLGLINLTLNLHSDYSIHEHPDSYALHPLMSFTGLLTGSSSARGAHAATSWMRYPSFHTCIEDIARVPGV